MSTRRYCNLPTLFPAHAVSAPLVCCVILWIEPVSRLRTIPPRRDVFALARGEGVKTDAECLELQPRDAIIELRGQRVDDRSEPTTFSDEPFRRECLGGERQIHHARRTRLRRGLTHEPAFGEQIHTLSGGQQILLRIRAHW